MLAIGSKAAMVATRFGVFVSDYENGLIGPLALPEASPPMDAKNLWFGADGEIFYAGASGRVYRAADAVLLKEAAKRNAVIATLDADFHALLAVSGARAPSVVRVRIEGLKGEELARALLEVVAARSAELTAGAAVSVTTDRIRVRRLPIGG